MSDEFVELRDGVRKAIRIADHDPEMALTRVRKIFIGDLSNAHEKKFQRHYTRNGTHLMT